MRPHSVYTFVLQRATGLRGGERGLANYLGVSRSRLRRWLQDDAVPPDVFLKLVDLLLDHALHLLQVDISAKRDEPRTRPPSATDVCPDQLS